MEQQPCPACGYDPSRLTPPDTEVAVRSFPRRFRELLEAAEEDEAGRATRRGSDGWSAADHAAAAAAGLRQLAGPLRQVAVSDDPQLDLPVVGGQAPAGAGIDDALAGLEASSRSVATVLDTIKGDAWDRSGHDASGHTWTALDLARLAVHLGVHHLRAAEHALA